MKVDRLIKNGRDTFTTDMYQLELWQCSSFSKDTRFYYLELCQDIFGNWIVRRTWGSAIKRDFGRSTSTICPDYQTGLLWYEKQQNRRKKRGYSLSKGSN